MANKESTAVNALIDLVQVKPLGGSEGPADDLFGAPKQPQPPAPLPRLRAPGGTSQLKLHDVPPSKVRMVTAPPTRGIPSIKQGTPSPRPSAPPPPRPSGTPTPMLTNPTSAPIRRRRCTDLADDAATDATAPRFCRCPAATCHAHRLRCRNRHHARRLLRRSHARRNPCGVWLRHPRPSHSLLRNPRRVPSRLGASTRSRPVRTRSSRCRRSRRARRRST